MPPRSHALSILAYTAVALGFTWPLPLQLATHLTGGPGGDTGVYVWNQWVFQHEVLDHGGLPYFTDQIFSLTSRANLSLHNYTIFQDVIALPLMRLLGVVATFNVVYLMMSVLTAYATFLLATHVTGRAGESWLAGLLFAWSPLLVTRGGGHFSLVAAAPLAIFLLVLLRADGHERSRDAVALGATMWWAAATDVYYAVYCLLIGTIFVIARVVSIERSPNAGRARAARWGLDVLVLCVAGLVAALVLRPGWEWTLAGRAISVHSLYTPVFVLTVLVLARIAWEFRASFAVAATFDPWRFARFASAAALVATVLLAPVLYAVGVRIADGGFESPKIYWRSSPPGVDLLAFALPNPNHPLAPDAISAWLAERPNAYLENVASVPLLAIAVLVLAWRTGWRPSAWWTGVTLLFGLLALGPFVHVAGVNTYVPGPWAVLRYVPLVGLAHTPARFSVVMMLGCAMLFALALTWIGRRYPRYRSGILAATVALLVFELLPAPLTLHSATIPRIYRHVAEAAAGTRVLELPFGVRDGTSSAGNFTARSQFFQTFHGKQLIGGYLSRVSRVRVSEMRRDLIVDGLMILSEGGSLSPERDARLVRIAGEFVTRARLAFVVIDRARTPDALREFAVRAFRLQHVETDGDLELYRPSVGLGDHRAE
jgi:hypothetical protein